jgi:hypothetical protein
MFEQAMAREPDRPICRRMLGAAIARCEGLPVAEPAPAAAGAVRSEAP